MSEKLISGKLPILALRGLAVFPDQTVHFDVGRKKSVLALDAAMKADQNILLIPQRDLMKDDPNLEDLFTFGTVAKVKQVLKSQGENLRVLVTGICRARISDLTQFDPYLAGMVSAVPETETIDSPKDKALRREANMLYGQYVEMSEYPAQSIQLRLMSSENNGFTADTIAQNSGIDFKDKAKLLMQLGFRKTICKDDEVARNILLQNKISWRNIPACREEVFFYLKEHDFIDKDAFRGMTSVRKGKGLPVVTEDMRTAEDHWKAEYFNQNDWMPSKAMLLQKLFFEFKSQINEEYI